MSGHPCETCLRWPECNGVDWGSCPESQALCEVRWYRPGPCPLKITRAQAEALFNDDEED